ncbi:hypothetical protein [Streptomyces sp. NPDC057702]|uniref:hypothetical protein n=1 Tax=Streptomyces sp. NPDC057702 TaxID=3346221 RepID=UPI003684A127
MDLPESLIDLRRAAETERTRLRDLPHEEKRGNVLGVRLPSDAERLRVLEWWLGLQLVVVHEHLAALGAPSSVSAQGSGVEQSPSPGWWVVWARAAPGRPRRGELHTVGCWVSAREPQMSRQEAAALLDSVRGTVAVCPVCGPPVHRRPGAA